MLVPLQRAVERIERAKTESDTTMFFDLLYLGEFVLKLVTSGFIAGIEDDRDSHRYRLVHKLVRADGIGEWSQSLDDVLSGPASQFLVPDAKEDRRIFTERHSKDAWQHRVVTELLDASKCFGIDSEVSSEKIALRSWFDLFPELRNKTRGHGAPKTSACTNAVTPLERSLRTIIDNCPLFLREWAYLRQNLSGKYHVVPLSDTKDRFDYLSRSKAVASDESLREGLYIHFDRPRYVDLVQTDVDLSDIYVPNGAFKGTHYELHSPLTDNKKIGDAKDYLAPASDRPASETSGRGTLVPLNNLWTNLPPRPESYVSRKKLEETALSLLGNDRHPIITLVGRGGIGKTSLALTVLHELAKTDRYGAIFWFSARDIDLTQAGPKLAKPDVLTENDIAKQFCDMLNPNDRVLKGFKNTAFMANNMTKSSIGDPMLFVFDNFETVRSPVDIFNWIDTNIRLPNKALITTRFRDFKADYPIEVPGMGRQEVDRLIDNTAEYLGSLNLFKSEVREAIFEESDGHPYIVKIIVGEITDKGYSSKPQKIIASKDDILQALFERTFINLSAGAKRIFLTLCGWRSYIPQIAIEALVVRNREDGFDISSSIDELERMSLVQKQLGEDEAEFLGVPLAAAIFGQKKLSTSPLRTAIELDVKFLQDLGPTNASAIVKGVAPRIRSLIKSLAIKIGNEQIAFTEARPLIEFIASRYPDAWMLAATLVNETQLEESDELEREYLRRYIESNPGEQGARQAWDRLAYLYKEKNDVLAACDAYTQSFKMGNPPFYAISNAASWLNNQRDVLDQYDLVDRKSVFMPLATLMEARLSEASATDLSRLAWLHLHAGNRERSEEVADLGLKMDPENVHCQRLIDRLTNKYH
jgi:hypothetical protein